MIWAVSIKSIILCCSRLNVFANFYGVQSRFVLHSVGIFFYPEKVLRYLLKTLRGLFVNCEFNSSWVHRLPSAREKFLRSLFTGQKSQLCVFKDSKPSKLRIRRIEHVGCSRGKRFFSFLRKRLRHETSIPVVFEHDNQRKSLGVHSERRGRWFIVVFESIF